MPRVSTEPPEEEEEEEEPGEPGSGEDPAVLAEEPGVGLERGARA